MSVVITSFFTRNGQPANDIETQTPGYPLVRIWQITDGTPSGDSFIGEFQMAPIEDGSNDDGFYKYEFTSANGYSDTNEYVFRVDGGSSLEASERYQTGEILPLADPPTIADAVWNEPLADHQTAGSTGEALEQADATADPAAVADAVWDETLTDHLSTGSAGEALSLTRADVTSITQNLFLDANSVLDVVQLLLKHETGRTRVDPNNATLTVYDEDCSTVLRTYQLLDSQGDPNINEVSERKPVTKGSSDNTTLTDTCP